MSKIYCGLVLSLLLACASAQTPKELGTDAVNSGNFSKAYALWLPLAEKGDPEVQEAIALLLANKVDVGVQFSIGERDAAVRYWILKAVKSGQRSAILWLSDALLNGWHGFKKSEQGAKCWKLVSDGQAVNADCERFVVELPPSN